MATSDVNALTLMWIIGVLLVDTGKTRNELVKF